VATISRFEPPLKEARLKLLEGDDKISIDEEKCPQVLASLRYGQPRGHIAARVCQAVTSSPLHLPSLIVYLYSIAALGGADPSCHFRTSNKRGCRPCGRSKMEFQIEQRGLKKDVD
jgi:hypothetical protein